VATVLKYGSLKEPSVPVQASNGIEKNIKIKYKYLCTTHCTNSLVVIAYEKTVHESNNSDPYKHI
jgi:hypothetical protein